MKTFRVHFEIRGLEYASDNFFPLHLRDAGRVDPRSLVRLRRRIAEAGFRDLREGHNVRSKMSAGSSLIRH